jgi:hypothetical protein
MKDITNQKGRLRACNRMREAYGSEDCQVLSQALSRAWDIFVKTGRLTSRNLDTAKAALSYAILEAAAKGERDPRRLAMFALAHAKRHEARIRKERSWATPRRRSA